MIIFYPFSKPVTVPVVILDALDSSDRFSDAQVLMCCYKYAPDEVTFIAPPEIFSCTYEFEFSHNGIPLGEGIKTHFTGSILSPPAALVSQFSPKYFTSAQSADDAADAFSKIANPQTTVTYAALVVRDQANNYIGRKFVAYAAHVEPDIFGATTTMAIYGASVEDIFINSEIAFILDKTKPLALQLTALLASAGHTAVFSTMTSTPVADKMFPPSRLRELLDEICLQNKLVYTISDSKVVTFLSQTEAPLLDFDIQKFSFLGYAGSLAWAIGVENYVNIRFKTPYFDAHLFQPITLYNDINSAFFSGLAKKEGLSLIDAYDAYIIRYTIRRSSEEIVTEVTASNNWLLSQMRVDGILEAKVYSASLGG
jgi:hypothetical protein